MKVLPLLAIAATVAALPIHADIKIIKVTQNGVASIENIPNVDLDDFHSLRELAIAAKSNNLHSDMKQHEDQNDEKSISIVDENESIYEALKRASVELYRQLFGDEDSRQSEELNEQAKMTLEKLAKTRPHAVRIDPSKMRAKGKAKCKGMKMHHGMRFKSVKTDSDQQTADQQFETLSPSMLTHEKIKEIVEKHGFTLEKFYHAHGYEIPAELEQGDGYSVTSFSSSVLDTLKDLYQDVSTIDYKDSFRRISQDRSAVMAVGSGVFCGIFLIVALSLIFNYLKLRKISNRYEEVESDEEEAELLNEKH